MPVIACPAGNYGVAVTDYDVTWDGSYVESGACEPSGASPPLMPDAKVAPAGTYVARFCATPGTLSTPDGGGFQSLHHDRAPRVRRDPVRFRRRSPW